VKANVLSWALTAVLPAALFLTGCSSGTGSNDSTNSLAVLPGETEPVRPEQFVAGVDHPYLPMRPGTIWIYEGNDDGAFRRDEIRVLDVPRVAVHEEVTHDGVPVESTTEWYVQDIAGNVWKFGEESYEREGGEFVLTDDSWVAGVHGAQPWKVMGATPRVGDLYVGNRPDGRDELEVVSVSASITVPAGVFLNCVEVVENADEPEDQDIIIYAPSVGLASEAHSQGRIDLVAVSGN
jgi:hypothetical protein